MVAVCHFILPFINIAYLSCNIITYICISNLNTQNLKLSNMKKLILSIRKLFSSPFFSLEGHNCTNFPLASLIIGCVLFASCGSQTGKRRAAAEQNPVKIELPAPSMYWGVLETGDSVLVVNNIIEVIK